MKSTITRPFSAMLLPLCVLIVLAVPVGADVTKSVLPEGVTARLGKGSTRSVRYSPGGSTTCGCGFHGHLPI